MRRCRAQSRRLETARQMMTDVDRGSYDPLPDEQEFDIEEYEDSGRGPFLLFVAFVVLAAFAGVVYVAYQQGVQQGLRQGRGADLPLVTAEPGPLKVAPEDPGGFEEPFQDQVVLNGEADAAVETLLPPPEEPVDDQVFEEEVLASSTELDEVAGENDTEILTIPLDDGEPTAADAAADDEIEVLIGETLERDAQEQLRAEEAEAEAETVATAEPSSPVEETPDTVTADVEDEPVITGAAATMPAGTQQSDPLRAVASGTHVVQVASVPSEALAEAKRAEMQEKFGSSARAGLSFDIQLADLGDRGTFYRLRIGPFDQRADAIAKCEVLKELGQDCYVTSP